MDITRRYTRYILAHARNLNQQPRGTLHRRPAVENVITGFEDVTTYRTCIGACYVHCSRLLNSVSSSFSDTQPHAAKGTRTVGASSSRFRQAERRHWAGRNVHKPSKCASLSARRDTESSRVLQEVGTRSFVELANPTLG